MFEDSTFESQGTIGTRSAQWMMATFALDGTVLFALILIPLLYPQALPSIARPIWMQAPAPPVQEPRPVFVQTPSLETRRPQFTGVFVSTLIHKTATYSSEPEPAAPVDTSALASAESLGSSSSDSVFNGQTHITVVQRKLQGPTRLSSGVMEGRLILKVFPSYSALQRALHLEGTVVLRAVISKTGTIENLRALSGPALLEQSALDAVKQWRYQPYLLNGEPVEVETTINVVFKLN